MNVETTKMKDPQNIDSITKQLIEVVAEKGVCFFEDEITEETYDKITESLGTIVGKDDIKLNVTQRKLHSTPGLPFHTDNPVANYITWYCLSPGEPAVATDLVDSYDVLNTFSADEIAHLKKYTMQCPNRTHDYSYQVPFLETVNDRLKIFYTPWFSQFEQGEQVDKCAREFAKKLNIYSKENVQHVFLKKNRFFAIDNGRMLHGRQKIAPDTTRSFKRRWIATGDYDKRLVE